MKSQDDKKQFSKMRSLLWPIHRHELKKFIPSLFLFFFVSFNYHFLRIAKDALIVTAPDSGVEAIPFLKVWGVLPSAVIITLVYARLANYFSRENIFYVVCSSFLLFYTLFLFVLYPYRDALCPLSFVEALQNVLPSGFQGLISMIRYWSFSLFYIMSESWSNIMLSLLLWGFANDMTTVDESKRFYPLFGIGVNSSGILAGEAGYYLSTRHLQMNAYEPLKAWEDTLYYFLLLILACGVASMLIFRWLHVHVHKETALVPIQGAKKKKMSLTSSLVYVSRSRYLICLAFIVLSYNLVINLTEFLWKTQMKELMPDSNVYTAYMSRVTYYIGIFATFTSYFLSGNIIRVFGWRKTALITPGIILFTGLAFFYCLFLKQYPELSPLLGFGSIATPLSMAVMFGTLQNTMSRTAKYTVFDDTKEMAFIPLSQEARFKGKAAIDGIGSRLGKCGGALLLQALIIFFNHPSNCITAIASLMAITLFVWIYSISSLSKDFALACKEIDLHH